MSRKRGSISVITPELVLSDRADQAEAAAPGEGADAVIWDEVSRQTGEDSRLTWSYPGVPGPGHPAGGHRHRHGLHHRDRRRHGRGPGVRPAGRAGRGTGPAPVAARTRRGRWPSASVFPSPCWRRPWPRGCPCRSGCFPADALDRGSAVEFIYHPGPYSLIVAVLAGTRRDAVGHQPALGGADRRVHLRHHGSGRRFVAVALVLGEYQKAAGSALQLFLNLVGIVAAAVGRAAVLPAGTKRRGTPHARQRNARRPAAADAGPAAARSLERSAERRASPARQQDGSAVPGRPSCRWTALVLVALRARLRRPASPPRGFRW